MTAPGMIAAIPGRLDGKVAIVTGAGKKGGLGRAMATRLAAEGACVIISDLGSVSGPKFPGALVGVSAEIEEGVAEITAAGGKAKGVPCDVRDESQIEALIAAAISSFGKLDILVNNAGIGYIMESVTEFPIEDWDTVLAVNLRGAFLGIKHAARHMIERGEGGRIISTASQAAKSGFPYATAYTASKHGLVGLTRSAAIELGKHQITVNAICPNHVTTPLGAWQNSFFSEKFGKSQDEYMADMKKRIPLGRPGQCEDTAAVCAFLASDQAAYITGEAVNVSGGEEMH